ncbi:MAG: Rossmann-like domain-containing protein [Candidatus Thorarchaeota archaeon]
MILEKTVEFVNKFYKDHEIDQPEITKVIIGLGYTGVQVSAYGYKPFVGLASTLPNIINKTDCSKIKFAGSLTNKPLSELLKWSYNPPSLKKIIGLATLNGISQYILNITSPYRKVMGDILEYIDIKEDTNITIIGLMKPLIRKLRKITRNLTLVEDTISIPQEFKDFKFRTNIDELEEGEIYTDILFCTGTSLINNTIEKILNLFRNKTQQTIVIGPSVGLLPDILFDSGVDIVGGMEITDSEATLKILQEGGGTKIFKKFGKKYNLINK